ncbi:MAG: YaaA family protein [Peptoniphilaceae bacterium]
MKNIIILSPSKEMKEIQGDKNLKINNRTKSIVDEIKKLSLNDLEKMLKVSPLIAEKNFKRYENLENSKAKEALLLYNGLCFRNMDIESYSQEDLAFAFEHIYILSALYGPIKASNPIAPYRLDFNTPLKIENKSLKTFWKKYYREILEKYKIFNLASNEFSSLLDKKSENFIDIVFYKDLSKNKKANSALAKKLRGQMASYIVKNKSFSLDILKNFTAFDYRFDKENSKENLLIYKEK